MYRRFSNRRLVAASTRDWKAALRDSCIYHWFVAADAWALLQSARMSEIPKAYEPQAVEEKWYQFWLDQKCFVADPARVSDQRPAYSIVIPPPNVTGVLHMGHVLNNTIQDILARKARMDGKEVLWLPGTDHAGIATEGMVAKQLRKEEKVSKQDIGREEFIKRVWQWKEKHGGIIISQLKKLGCSCDWTRERFTMDADYVRNVQRVFVDLYKKGLICRGKRMVNWCPATLTALSDEEVEMESQKGFLYYFKVQVVEADGKPVGIFGPQTDSEGRIWLTIATTRPETIPGDTAVAVNPKDPRYAHLIGKHVVRPLPIQLPLEKRLIPIIGDEYVDFEFGTGVLKVTPAHDKNDFEIGQRHKLAAVDIMNPNATMNDLAGKDLAGLDRFEARKVAVERLKELGALEKEEPYENKIGFSQRARVPIEPRLSEQWFLKYPSEAAAMSAVRGRDVITFRPAHWADVYVHWMFRIQDWCISRQLWWGHRIPVWRGNFQKASRKELVSEIVAGLSAARLLGATATDIQETAIKLNGEFLTPDLKKLAELAEQPARTRGDFKLEVSTPSQVIGDCFYARGLEQDPDVLDTWFSSWLWPFATMGWPEQTDTLKKFYPTTDLVTAPEIIFFWVARMIMAGYEFMGEPKFGLPDAMPFRNVYFTGIVRDKQGRKMSKSLGNSPDPVDLIAKYGADAVRFGTMRSAPLGQDVLFDEKDVELGRNFCNKLWNACRFRQMQGSAPASDTTAPAPTAVFEVQGEINPSLLTNDDKWILLKLHQAIREITEAFAEYKFNEAAATLYRFFWSEYCDWYVEASKAVLTRPTTDAFPSPLKGERAGVRGKNVGDRTNSPSPHPTLSLPSGSGEGDARRANTLAVIDFILSHTLRLFHPFLPFITEELWHGMGYAEDMPEDQGGRTIMNAPWPKPFDGDFRDHYSLDDCYLEFAQAKYDLVTEGRNLRRIGNVPASKKVKFIFKPANEVLPHDAEVIKLLLNAEALEINSDYQPAKGTPTARAAMGDLFLPLEGLVDVEAEKARLKKEIEKGEAEISKVEQKLANPNFTQKAPPQVLQEHQQRLAEWQAKLEHANNALKGLGG